jgi:hypothetical protein
LEQAAQRRGWAAAALGESTLAAEEAIIAHATMLSLLSAGAGAGYGPSAADPDERALLRAAQIESSRLYEEQRALVQPTAIAFATHTRTPKRALACMTLAHARTTRAANRRYVAVSPFAPRHICAGTAFVTPRQHREWAHPPSSIYTGSGLAPPHLRRDWPALVWTRWHEEADIIAALRLSDAQAESARAQLFEAELADALRRTEARRADSVSAQMWPGRVQSRCRCGQGGFSPGADVARAGSVPAHTAPAGSVGLAG